MTFIAWLLVSSDAHACSCIGGILEVLPADGATGVATDAVPFLAYDDPPGIVRLVDGETGAEVPATIEQTTEGQQTIVRVVPAAPLEPLHAYVISGDAEPGLVPFPSAFTTGEGPDEAAPDAVTLLDVREPRSAPDDDCGGGAVLIQDLDGRPADAFYETQLAWTEDFSDARTVSGADVRLVGQAGCLDTLSELELGDEVWLRARAVDLSGNVGPWTDPFHVGDVGFAEEPERRGCDTSGGRHAVLALGLVALVLRGRGTAR